jgi:hypothetical protein
MRPAFVSSGRKPAILAFASQKVDNTAANESQSGWRMQMTLFPGMTRPWRKGEAEPECCDYMAYPTP